MSKTPNFLHSENAENFVEFCEDSDVPRAVIEPHFVQDENSVIFITPASRLVLGGICDSETGDEISTLRLHSAAVPIGLVYAFMPDEMRSLSKMLLDCADKIEAEAKKKAADALARAMKGDA